MELPIISKFIKGLKLFFESKRLRWLTLIFLIGAFFITIMERVAAAVPWLINTTAVIAIGGVFPVFFLITAFVSLLGFQRFIADDESYGRSLVLFVPWLIVSIVVLVISIFFFLPIFSFIMIGVAFLGWIGFQAYFASRSSLGYARSIQVESRSKLTTILFGAINIFNYVVIIGAAVFTILFINPGIINPLDPAYSLGTVALAIGGVLLAVGFNFLNGWIIALQRNKQIGENVTLLGLFVSLYSAYFIYNVLKGVDLGLDLVSIAISIFFILYTMSSIGLSLASRAEMDTRLKLSKELAATFTFFLASGYMFVDSMLTLLVGDPQLGAAAGDIIKLYIFPLVALIMEIRFILQSRKVVEKPEEPDEIPVVPEVDDDEEPEEVPEEEPEEVELPEPEDTFTEAEEGPDMTTDEPADTEEDYVVEPPPPEEEIEEPDFSDEEL